MSIAHTIVYTIVYTIIVSTILLYKLQLYLRYNCCIMVYTLAEPKNWSWALMTKALSLGEGGKLGK